MLLGNNSLMGSALGAYMTRVRGGRTDWVKAMQDEGL